MRRFALIFSWALSWAGGAVADVPKVVTDIAPVQSLVAAVMGDLGSPDVLITGTQEPHSFQLRPSQARLLARADLVFWIGPDLTPWLGPALDVLADGAQDISLLALPDSRLRSVRDAPGITDPHAWLDPDNAVIWLTEIAATLSDIDPDNRPTYARNAAIAAAQLQGLLHEIQILLAPYSAQNLIFAHDAYGYFTARFRLQFAGSLASGNAASPGAAHLRSLRRLIQSGSIACAFGEPQQNPALLRTLVAGTPVPSASLDPTGSNLTVGPDLYPALIRAIASTISDCLKR